MMICYRWALCSIASPNCKQPKLDETLIRFVMITACFAPIFGAAIILSSGDVIHLLKTMYLKVTRGSAYTFNPWSSNRTTATTQGTATSGRVTGSGSASAEVRSAIDASSYADADWNY